MRQRFVRIIGILGIALLFIPFPGMAIEPDAAAASQITVTSVSMDPAVFFEDDTGIITIEITNNGPESVAIRRATMYDEKILVVSNSYDTTTTIGAGNKMQFRFTVKADVPPGIYYPIFSLDFRDAGYLRYPVPLRVDNDPLEVSILNKPDTFGPGRKEQIDILIGNPRDNPVTGTIVHFLGKDLDPTPSSLFVGVLNPDQAQKIPFNVTPREPTKLEIVVDYRNGVNSHSTMIAVPVLFGESKIRAEPILSNIVVEFKDGHYTLTGDVFNAGLEVANSVVITTGEGGQPVNPYREYVVGSLQPDDFSSFELTFTADNTSTVDMVVNYRDVDGNPFFRTTPVTIPAKTTAKEKQPGVALPIIAVIAISAAVIGGAIWYSWKKK